MKRVLLVLVIAAVLATGTAFAGDPRPDGLGIGVVAGYGGGWSGGGGSSNVGLALHLSDIYWGINLGLGENHFALSVTGDFMTLTGGNISGPFGWYIDLGLYGGLGLATAGDNANLSLNFGARLPIGLNLNFKPIDIWLAVVPRIGVDLNIGHGDFLNLGGGWGSEFGIRLWL